jgi:hypothetical protein
MNLNDYCAPALLYVAFSLTHIIIDLFKHLYNTALVKFIVMIIFTFLLNLLCQRGLTVISWFIVFIPFITMTVITTLLLIIFGLSPFTGKVEKTNLQPGHHISPDNNIKPGHHHDNNCKDKHHSMEHDKFYN